MSQIIKKRKRKFLNIKNNNEEEDHESIKETLTVLEETKELQKLRKKPNGVNLEKLSRKKPITEEKPKKDISKIGGYIDVKALKKGLSQVDDIDQIGTSFAIETNQRDEDAMMLNYVEEQMAKRQEINQGQEINQEDKKEKSSKELKNKPKTGDDFLFELPNNMKHLISKKKNEESISNQMLSGIPEVDLGIEVKIRNIEETEAAKQRLLRERLEQRDKGVSHFVPTNMAVNFVQHNRFTMEESSLRQKTLLMPTPTPVLRVGDRLDSVSDLSISGFPANEKATDDFHYEKFKKHMRRLTFFSSTL